jgi:hypothetical protein
MARPTRTNAEWFMHPAAFRNDRRVKAIRARYGACGYGLLLMLIELLTDADNTSLATDEIEIELLAGDLSATAEEVLSLIQVGVKVGLFTRTDAGLLKCPQLDEWLAPVFEKRNRARNAAPPPKLPQPAAETGVSVTETTQSTVEYSREEESTEQASSFQSEDAASAAAPTEEVEEVELPSESQSQGLRTPGGAASSSGKPAKKDKPARFAPPTAEEMLAYMLDQRPYNRPSDVQRVCDKCFGYYSGNGWKVGRNPMKDWKGACQTFLADLPKLVLGQMPIAMQQTGYSGAIRPVVSQVSTRAAAIAGADAMFDAMAAGKDPFANHNP